VNVSTLTATYDFRLVALSIVIAIVLPMPRSTWQGELQRLATARARPG
jgi:hypothetical protein